MMNLIVSDTTALIVLERLNALSMLCSLFDQILIPQAVMDELLDGNSEINELMQRAECYNVVSVTVSEHLLELYQWLDRGEAEAIELLQEFLHLGARLFQYFLCKKLSF